MPAEEERVAGQDVDGAEDGVVAAPATTTRRPRLLQWGGGAALAADDHVAQLQLSADRVLSLRRFGARQAR